MLLQPQIIYVFRWIENIHSYLNVVITQQLKHQFTIYIYISKHFKQFVIQLDKCHPPRYLPPSHPIPSFRELQRDNVPFCPVGRAQDELYIAYPFVNYSLYPINLPPSSHPPQTTSHFSQVSKTCIRYRIKMSIGHHQKILIL